ncbi:MAG: hypothetical protein JW991_02075 [Candidatus Pacebacteria bacterium]|nr:hypothetical protein [Candidatus Paceibacterota bacterium]
MGKEQELLVEVSTSLMNYFSAATFYTAFWPVSRQLEKARQAGYSGLEWHPTRLGSLQVKLGVLKERDKDYIQCGHQGFGAGFSDIFTRSKSAFFFFQFCLLPQSIDSLADLRDLQKVIGRDLPVVLYPSGDLKKDSVSQKLFAEKTFQPSPELMSAWGIRTIDELEEAMAVLGYEGFCLDTHHFRDNSEEGLNPWSKTIERLLRNTREIHISVGRIDAPKPGVDTLEELKDLLSGSGESQVSKILTAIKDLGWQGRVVTEIPTTALLTVRQQDLGYQESFLRPNDLVSDHQRIVASISKLLSS